jgi:hypothetical protein
MTRTTLLQFPCIRERLAIGQMTLLQLAAAQIHEDCRDKLRKYTKIKGISGSLTAQLDRTFAFY